MQFRNLILDVYEFLILCLDTQIVRLIHNSSCDSLHILCEGFFHPHEAHILRITFKGFLVVRLSGHACFGRYQILCQLNDLIVSVGNIALNLFVLSLFVCHRFLLTLQGLFEVFKLHVVSLTLFNVGLNLISLFLVEIGLQFLTLSLNVIRIKRTLTGRANHVSR